MFHYNETFYDNFYVIQDAFIKPDGPAIGPSVNRQPCGLS